MTVFAGWFFVMVIVRVIAGAMRGFDNAPGPRPRVGCTPMWLIPFFLLRVLR